MTGVIIDSHQFRQTLGHFCTGIVVVAAVDAGEPVGFTCQSFTSLSLDPPLVGFAPSVTSRSYPAIRRSGSFCINVLADSQQWLSVLFASRDDNKWQAVRWSPAPSGSPIIDGVLASIDCRIEAEHQTGDHHFVVGRVQELRSTAGAPLLYFKGQYSALA